MNKVKVHFVAIVSLIAALLITLAAAFGATFTGRMPASAEITPVDYSPSSIFASGGVAGTVGASEGDESYIEFTFRDGGRVYFRRDLAYKWFTADTEADSTLANPGKANYFSMEFTLPSLDFETFTISFESAEESVTEEEKAVVMEKLPAIMAGVPRILAVSSEPFAPAVITALELAGLEDSFVLDAEGLASLYEDLRAVSPDGRILFFPGPEGPDEAMKDLMHKAAADGTAAYRDKAAPRILSLYKNTDTPAAGEVAKRLLWLHPDATLLDMPSPGMDAVFTPQPCAETFDAPLTAGPGMEACWPGPSPEFFRTGALCAQLVQEIRS